MPLFKIKYLQAFPLRTLSLYMLRLVIPGYKVLQLAHLLTDYNGTVAVDGKLVPGVAARLATLAQHLQIHIITADTFGLVEQQVTGLPCQVVVIGPEDQAGAKLQYIQALGPEQTVALGNGRNDHLMVQAAGLGIAILMAEGAASKTIQAADVLTPSILDALDLTVDRNPALLSSCSSQF